METVPQEVRQTVDIMTAELKGVRADGLNAGIGLYNISRIPDEDDEQFDLKRAGMRATIARYDAILSEPDQPDPILTEARKRAEKFIRKNGALSPEEAAEAAWRYFAHEIAALDAYETLRYKINPGKTTCVRAYSDQLATYLGWGLTAAYIGHPERDTIAKVIDAYSRIGVQGDTETNWVGMKLSRLSSCVREANLVLGSFIEFDAMSELERAQLEAENTSLWKESKKLGKYGLASVLAPTNLQGISEWSVISGHDVRAKVTESAQINLNDTDLQQTFTLDIDPCRYSLEYAAGLFTATNGRFTESDPTIEPINVGGNHLGSHMMIRVEDDESSETAAIILDRRGELKTLTGVPLREMCERYECADAYEQLRAELLALNFDLTVPTYVVKAMATADREAVEANPRWGVKDRLRYLVIARRKYIRENRKGIKDALNEEKKAGIDRTDVHSVKGHVRELPEAYRASQEARDWAWKEAHILLAESGQTWVHTHERPGAPAKGPRRALVVSGQYATRQAARSGGK